MAINTNHIFEELEGVKCSVIEKSCSAERASFLRELLELNGFTVVVVKSPPPKAPVKPAAETESAGPKQEDPEAFTVGVTDVTFNAVNAIYNRELKTKDGAVVTPAYWRQSSTVSREESWYWKME